MVALGRVEVRGQATVSGRSVHIDLAHPAQFRLAITLFLPGPLVSVLAGVMSGTAGWDADPQPAATRILMICIPDGTGAALEASNRYLDATELLRLTSQRSAWGSRPRPRWMRC